MSSQDMDWCLLDDEPATWFDAPSLVEGAAFAARLLEISSTIAVDIRPTGLRVRLPDISRASTVSAAARDAGLAARPDVLAPMSVVLASHRPSDLTAFWQRALGYAQGGGEVLLDPLRRDPTIRIRRSTDDRPLRNRVHVDVVRPALEVDRAALGEPTGPFGVRHADRDGNEVDLVPGSPLTDSPQASDWHQVFGAMACYRSTSSGQQRELAVAAAQIAHDAGFPLLIDLRQGLVVLDSGKDRWEPDAHGLDLDFTLVAERIQTVARRCGARADPRLPRCTQLFLDAADIATVKQFWLVALGYEPDPRDGIDDIVDPRRLGPVLAFQQIDVSETRRRDQRNRIHVELAMSAGAARSRLDRMLAAGGTLLEATDSGWHVADPEGNELVVVVDRRPSTTDVPSGPSATSDPTDPTNAP
ncbi:VOC family protein [Georgenia sp. Z1344]|uniref:VOC family protein n=1 Tax=Georgenia sp. Z1344 TaxID=3416706 RepID=UPI003CF85CAF